MLIAFSVTGTDYLRKQIKRGKIYFAHGFSWSWWGGHGGVELFKSCQSGTKERDREGPRTKYSTQGHAPQWSTSFS
jgi:hypothetical protein